MLKASVAVIRAQDDCYFVHSFDAEGIHIRQYVGKASDQVFALAWNGFRHPDLQTLMGANNFQEYVQGQQDAKTSSRKRARSHSGLNVSTANLKVRMSGTLRSKHGLVFLKNQIPSCVAHPEELQ